MDKKFLKHPSFGRFADSKQCASAVQSVKEVADDCGVLAEKGLTSKIVLQRIQQYGFNQIKSNRVYWWHILWRQVKSPFIFLLFFAAGIAFFARQAIDGVLIMLFVCINTLVGFYQEYRSEHTARLLQSYIVSLAKVYRDGKVKQVNKRELVRGDIVILETGDKVPADMRLIEARNVIIDESILTGESSTAQKHSEPMSAPPDLYSANNLVFEGTLVVGGSGRGIVIATGKESILGTIARLTLETSKESGFNHGISRLSTFILRLVVVTLVFIFLGQIFIKGHSADIGQLLLFSIALSVSVIPEALPIVTTFSLSRGALRLAKNKVVVKRLSAIEDLGGIQVLCTDKTGTITENALTVTDLMPGSFKETFLYASLAGQNGNQKREPFDIALMKKLTEEEKKGLAESMYQSEIPFDPVKRRSGAIVQFQEKTLFIIRGAPEEVAAACGAVFCKREEIEKWAAFQGHLGRRALAVAFKEMPPNWRENDEKNLQLAGLISFVDPIKKSTIPTIKKAEKLNVAVKLITGDSREVAGAVAKEIGLISDEHSVITGGEFMAMPIHKQSEAVDAYHVFARVLPEQKFHIVSLLQQKYEVGFLGEGINDAPALKIAGVSLVVQSAADVAREAADILLLQKDLRVIIDGIAEGRQVFVNTIKYIKATLASNFGNFYAVAVSSLLIDYLPMLPVQILLLNLLSDFPMISIATDTVDKRETASPQSYHIKDIALIALFLGIVSTVFDFLFFAIFARTSPEALQTSWFIGSVLTELAFLFSIRTRLPFFKAKRPSFYILFLTVAAALTTLALPYTQFGQTVFHFIPPTAYHLKIIFSLTALYFIASEVMKFFYYKLVERGQ